MHYNSELWIDDIVLEDIGVGWYNNYITNGKFTDDLNCWTTTAPTGSSITLDNNTNINGSKTAKLQLNNQLSTWEAAGISWSVHLYSGSKYYYQFDAISETGMDVKARLLQDGNLISELEPQHITGTANSYRFVFPEITEDNTYTVDLNFGRAANNSTAWISNIMLVPCLDGDCTNSVGTSISPTPEKLLVNVYPNPTTDLLFISTEENIREVSLYNMQGKLCKRKAIGSYECKLNVSDLAVGSYILRISTNSAEIRQIILKK